MIAYLIRLLVNSPVYPHWLEHLKMKQGNRVVLRGITGDVLEVGAGDGSRKIAIGREFPAIKTYLSTDCSTWDDEFRRDEATVARYGKAVEIFLGRQGRSKLDDVCSATELPYEDSSFDAHLSFEVLEHIYDPKPYFSEAARVVRKKGKVIFSVPFLYREHTLDFQRYTKNFLEVIAKDNQLKAELIYSNTGLGTTMAALVNQWTIRRVLEGPILIRPLLLVVSPAMFLASNVLGWIVDLKPDSRFATRYHVVLRKL
jgi:SAM-dependent methyltransferase